MIASVSYHDISYLLPPHNANMTVILPLSFFEGVMQYSNGPLQYRLLFDYSIFPQNTYQICISFCGQKRAKRFLLMKKSFVRLRMSAITNFSICVKKQITFLLFFLFLLYFAGIIVIKCAVKVLMHSCFQYLQFYAVFDITKIYHVINSTI